MVRRVMGLAMMLAVVAGSGSALHGQQKEPGFTLSSPAFPDGGEIPLKYSQASPNPVSVPLAWSQVPAGTVSFVMMMRDPDVAFQKKAEDILHYMVFNIPGTAQGLAEGVPAVAVLPDGTVQPKNFRGQPGYLPPGAPAPGPHHHYTWEVYALDTKLELGPDATRGEVVKAMEGHALGKAVMVGRFHR